MLSGDPELHSRSFTTVTDQAGKTRRSMLDGLGRLIRVDEPDSNGSLGSTSSPNQATSYDYDVFGNLLHVYQGSSQTRTFSYDSLSRLRSANNPESGTVTYAYDDNGNLTSKSDARSVTTTITYDSINRPTQKSYSDSTPSVTYYYDSQSLPSGAPSYTHGYATGRLVACIYGSGSEGTYRGYDELGQVVRQYQRTDSVNYLVEATYNLAGGMATETYPSVPGASDRRTVSFSYDNAARLSSLSSSATSYAPAASVSSISYAATNALSSQTYGNNLIQALSYNSRQQTSEIKLGTSGNSTSVLDLTYSYGTTSNNGNLQSVTYAGGGLSYTQSFSYDSLNRLSSATETNGGTTNWTQNDVYDRYGNRQIDYGGGNYNLAFSSSTNRITTSGYSYDSAGNLTNDTIHAYTFDAENKIKTVDSTTAYVYDGEGQRVRKLVVENTRFVYGIGGQLVAEFDGSSGNLKKEYINGSTLITIEPTAVNSNGTRYTTSDHLGSPRVVSDSSASVVSRHDFMPFGEELAASVGGRTTGMGFSVTDGLRQKFTLKERDIETGLDYFEARYFSSTQGRFTSTDPLMASARLTKPQSWNRYSYCLNNPLRYIDPTGEDPEDEEANIHKITTTTTRQVIVQDADRRGNVNYQATVTVTETQSRYVNDSGNEVGVDPIQTTAVAENSGNAPLHYSNDQLRTMENVAVNIVEVSREKGFDSNIALGIAVTETRMGTDRNTQGVEWKNSAINPMQLSEGAARGGTLRSNIAGAIDLYNNKAGPAEVDRLRQYRGSGSAVVDANYASVTEGRINNIRSSVNQTVYRHNNWNLRDYRPPRVGPFPIWRPE